MCIRDSGKAGEVTAAIAKGVESAKKNLVKVPVLKGTVPHEQSARFGGAAVSYTHLDVYKRQESGRGNNGGNNGGKNFKRKK